MMRLPSNLISIMLGKRKKKHGAAEGGWVCVWICLFSQESIPFPKMLPLGPVRAPIFW